MAYTNFTPTAYGQLIAPGTVSSPATALPGGGGPTLIVTNIGTHPAIVLLGGSTVQATITTGIAVAPNQSLPLAVGSNGYIAAIGTGYSCHTILNLAQGT